MTTPDQEPSNAAGVAGPWLGVAAAVGGGLLLVVPVLADSWPLLAWPPPSRTCSETATTTIDGDGTADEPDASSAASCPAAGVPDRQAARRMPGAAGPALGGTTVPREQARRATALARVPVVRVALARAAGGQASACPGLPWTWS